MKMFRLSLKILSRRPSSEPGLFPSDCPLDSLPVAGTDAADPLQLNDLSYKDALLDRQIATFLQTEYGEASAADPRHSLSAVLHSIESREPSVVRRPSFALPVANWFQAAYRLVNGPGVARLVPGGVALMLLLSVFGADVTSML